MGISGIVGDLLMRLFCLSGPGVSSFLWLEMYDRDELIKSLSERDNMPQLKPEAALLVFLIAWRFKI